MSLFRRMQNGQKMRQKMKRHLQKAGARENPELETLQEMLKKLGARRGLVQKPGAREKERSKPWQERKP